MRVRVQNLNEINQMRPRILSPNVQAQNQGDRIYPRK